MNLLNKSISKTKSYQAILFKLCNHNILQLMSSAVIASTLQDAAKKRDGENFTNFKAIRKKGRFDQNHKVLVKFPHWGILNYSDSLCIKVSTSFYIASPNPNPTAPSTPQYGNRATLE